MAQDIPIYDDTAFLANYLTLPRQQQGHDGAPEWPILRTMVSSVRGHKVLDLGCGLGWFARWAVDNGAAHVDALDISTKMIEKAKEMTPAEQQSVTNGINYQVKDVSSPFTLEEGSYDLIYSSLALHYLSTSSLTALLPLFFAALKPNGRLVFSVEHPIYIAPTHDDFVTIVLPSSKTEELIWPLNRYGSEGLRETNWLGGSIKKYHRTVTTYVQKLLDAGFAIGGFREYMATEEDLEKEPQWKGALERPIFLLIKAEKGAA
ncbi:hypothetical protein N0V90_001293 [Kalmusia sp. IMI 367209]|nr:hypothetical protein N0V90_001293 [Kalmusia sp. IMI 367209]